MRQRAASLLSSTPFLPQLCSAVIPLIEPVTLQRGQLLYMHLGVPLEPWPPTSTFPLALQWPCRCMVQRRLSEGVALRLARHVSIELELLIEKVGS